MSNVEIKSDLEEIAKEEEIRREQFERAKTILENIDNIPFFEAFTALKGENSIIKERPICWRAVFNRSTFLSKAKEMEFYPDMARFKFDGYEIEVSLSEDEYIKLYHPYGSAKYELMTVESEEKAAKKRHEGVLRALDIFQNKCRPYHVFGKIKDNYLFATHKIARTLGRKVTQKWTFSMFFNKEFRDAEVNAARKIIQDKYDEFLMISHEKCLDAQANVKRGEDLVAEVKKNLSEFEGTSYMENFWSR